MDLTPTTALRAGIVIGNVMTASTLTGRRAFDQLRDQRGTYGPGTGWVVFADPEGNQFCILRSLDEVHADPSS